MWDEHPYHFTLNADSTNSFMIQNHTLRVEPVTSDKQHEYWIHKQLPTSAQGMTCVHSQTNLGYFISLF